MKPNPRRLLMSAWITLFFTLSIPVGDAADSNNRKLPRLYSFYLDDGSCVEHSGERTQELIWNGRSWNLTAPEALVSPPSETERTGTPLDIRPLHAFLTQAQKLGRPQRVSHHLHGKRTCAKGKRTTGRQRATRNGERRATRLQTEGFRISTHEH